MSARAALYAAVMSGGYHSPDRSEHASALIDAFAHELAERIRNDREPWEWALAGQHAGHDAADLIDPEEA